MSNENLTEKTLADVQAGIPARDAEIETLRKENAELREQLEAIGAGGVRGKLMPGAVSAEPLPDIRYIAKGDMRFIDGQWMTCTDPEIGRWQGSAAPVGNSGSLTLDEKRKILDDNRLPYDAQLAAVINQTEREVLMRTKSVQAQPEHFDNETKMVAGCCGRSECGGECGNDWAGMVPAPQPVSGADGLPTDLELDGWAEDLSRLGYESNREGVEAYLRKLFSDRAALAQQDADNYDGLVYRTLLDNCISCEVNYEEDPNYENMVRDFILTFRLGGNLGNNIRGMLSKPLSEFAERCMEFDAARKESSDA